jgi:hypothetical protein
VSGSGDGLGHSVTGISCCSNDHHAGLHEAICLDADRALAASEELRIEFVAETHVHPVDDQPPGTLIHRAYPLQCAQYSGGLAVALIVQDPQAHQLAEWCHACSTWHRGIVDAIVGIAGDLELCLQRQVGRSCQLAGYQSGAVCAVTQSIDERLDHAQAFVETRRSEIAVQLQAQVCVLPEVRVKPSCGIENRPDDAIAIGAEG